ncbi:MAG: WecB/TagA/CpsF family glycosyltransferase [Kosmotoga sp.]|nr:MAG: WecB/TagA/CpsF family glycosyltransferase [Kosmotoga sp.]
MKFLDFEITEGTIEDHAKRLLNSVKNDKKFVLTLNTLIADQYLHNPEYGKALKKVNYIVPDGFGIVKAIKILKKKKMDRVPGIELMEYLCEEVAKTNRGVFFLGSSQESVNRASKELKRKFPALKIAGVHHGYFNESESDRIVNKINNSGASILFVAMGVPKQEIWISKHLDQLDISIIMGVGGSFDVFAGLTKRAPLWMREHGLEWLYRIMKNPFRRMKVFFRLIRFAITVWKFEKKRPKNGGI